LADGRDSLSIDTRFSAGAGVIDNNGTIIVNGITNIFAGTDFNMLGGDSKLIVNGILSVATPDFNLDGNGFAGNVTTINAGGELDLNLGIGADEDFDHLINMNGGELDVTTADTNFSLATAGRIVAAGGATSTVNGLNFVVNGDITVTGNSTLVVNANTEFNVAAGVQIDAGSTLDMGNAFYNGGGYVGEGTLRKGIATINAPTVWSVDTVHLDDGPTTVNANLTINADSIDLSGDGADLNMTIADTALLTVNMSGGSWTVNSGATVLYNGVAGQNTFLAGSNLVLNGSLNILGAAQTDAVLNIGNSPAGTTP
jgi:hypothetical protein